MRKHMGGACACQSEQTWLEASLEETLIVQTEGCSNEKNEKIKVYLNMTLKKSIIGAFKCKGNIGRAGTE